MFSSSMPNLLCRFQIYLLLSFSLLVTACSSWQKEISETNASKSNSEQAVFIPIPEVSISYLTAEQAKQQKEVTGLCSEIGNRLGSVSIEDCLKHQFTHSGHYSVQSRPLVYLDSETAQASQKVLVVGGTHGDEYSSYSLMFRWLEKLDSTKADIDWRFIPALNPDGLMQKKASRMNANGVDINRNFHTSDWLDHALSYWKNRTGSDPRRYPGAQPLSEPEAKWLDDVIKTWAPDVIVSVHAPYGILDFDAPDLRKQQAPNQLGILHLKLLGTYPGSLGRYAGEEQGIPVLTLELPHAGIMPSKQQIHDLWQDLVTWVIDQNKSTKNQDGDQGINNKNL